MAQTIEQISVFVENKPGRLAAILSLLADAGIDLRAMSIADSADFGILRVIVDEPARCKAVLQAADCIVSVTQVLAVCIPDEPGSLSKVMSVLAACGESIEYLYAFITRRTTDAYVILRPENLETAARSLSDAGIILAEQADLYAL